MYVCACMFSCTHVCARMCICTYVRTYDPKTHASPPTFLWMDHVIRRSLTLGRIKLFTAREYSGRGRWVFTVSMLVWHLSIVLVCSHSRRFPVREPCRCSDDGSVYKCRRRTPVRKILLQSDGKDGICCGRMRLCMHCDQRLQADNWWPVWRSFAKKKNCITKIWFSIGCAQRRYIILSWRNMLASLPLLKVLFWVIPQVSFVTESKEDSLFVFSVTHASGDVWAGSCVFFAAVRCVCVSSSFFMNK